MTYRLGQIAGRPIARKPPLGDGQVFGQQFTCVRNGPSVRVKERRIVVLEPWPAIFPQPVYRHTGV